LKLLKPINGLSQIQRKLTSHSQWFPINVFELHSPTVEENARRNRTIILVVRFGILRVAHYWVPSKGEMRPNLVDTIGQRTQLH
jgi:hypothetical protein